MKEFYRLFSLIITEVSTISRNSHISPSRNISIQKLRSPLLHYSIKQRTRTNFTSITINNGIWCFLIRLMMIHYDFELRIKIVLPSISKSGNPLVMIKIQKYQYIILPIIKFILNFISQLEKIKHPTRLIWCKIRNCFPLLLKELS